MDCTLLNAFSALTRSILTSPSPLCQSPLYHPLLSFPPPTLTYEQFLATLNLPSIIFNINNIQVDNVWQPNEANKVGSNYIFCHLFNCSSL